MPLQERFIGVAPNSMKQSLNRMIFKLKRDKERMLRRRRRGSCRRSLGSLSEEDEPTIAKLCWSGGIIRSPCVAEQRNLQRGMEETEMQSYDDMTIAGKLNFIFSFDIAIIKRSGRRTVLL